MALIQTPYEILIRYNTDGTFQGAQVQWLFTDSDGQMPATIGAAVPLTKDGTDAFALPTVLGQALTAALDANTALKAANAAQSAQIAALSDQVATLSHFGN